MYKFKSYMMAMLAVGSMAFLSSCGDDEDPKPAPTITLDGPNDANSTVAAGSPITTDVIVTNNGGANIMTFNVTVSYDGAVAIPVPGYNETDINESTYETTFTINARSQAGEETYNFIATNKDGQTTTKSVTITVTGNSPTAYTAKIMGAVQNSAGSFFSTQTGEVYTTSTAPTNSNKVDFVYFNQNGGGLDTLGATITSPSNSNAQIVYPTVASWGTKNTTEFRMGSSSDFASATNTSLASAYAGAGTTMDMAHNLAVNDVVLFETEDGRYGAFKVTAISTTPSAAAGSITIDVKVQP